MRLLPLLLAGCTGAPMPPAVEVGPPVGDVRWRDVSGTNLPESTLTSSCLDASFFDADGDGDPDVFVGNEFKQNLLLLNDGSGLFVDASDRLPRPSRDSEDAAIADFDGDGDLDLVIVSEDDFVNEYYLNDGAGRFEDAGDRIRTEGRSNAVASADLDGDGDQDVVIGNNGQNVLLLNDGNGRFEDRTTDFLPAIEDATQDLELGDVDGDGRLDLVVGNEDANRLLLGQADGRFKEVPFPVRSGAEETRDVDLADVDGDGAPDVLLTNVDLSAHRGDVSNRLLLNRNGAFEEASDFPVDEDFTMDADFVDIDGDGDLDIVHANYGDRARGRALTPYRVYVQTDGRFEERTDDFFPSGSTGHGFDVEIGDVNGDGRPDFYLCSGRSLDRLLLSEVL